MSRGVPYAIEFHDKPTAKRTAKPAGVIGAEMWKTIGGPAAFDSSVRSPCRTCVPPLLALDPGHEYASRAGAHTPYTLDFVGADGGKPAHYLARWANSEGETEPWSETVSVTIGA